MANWKFPFGGHPSSQNPQPALQPKIKSLAELEAEMEAEAKQVHARPLQSPQPAPIQHQPWSGPIQRRVLNRFAWAALLIGIPAGMVWIANLPYPVIRRPVAQNAPILLLPSYVSVDKHFRQAIASVQEAKQLIDNATSPADLERGRQKVEEAQKHLDALPLDFLNIRPEYRYWWYDWRFSRIQFSQARAEVARLNAKVFQEGNAQTLLADGEQSLNTAKQQYNQAKTPTDKRIAIEAWRSALDKLTQIPGETLAGKVARQKLDIDQRDFREVVGLAAGNEHISTLIKAAQEFSWQAAKAGQHPPHTVTEWQQVKVLWQQAIESLKQIPSDDLAGYAEAQRLLAQYEANLGQIEIRLQAEAESAQALQEAKRNIESLLANTPTDPNSLNRNLVISRLQRIINDLERVSSGTIAYLEAQEILLSAKNKLNQLQSQQ